MRRRRAAHRRAPHVRGRCVIAPAGASAPRGRVAARRAMRVLRARRLRRRSGRGPRGPLLARRAGAVAPTRLRADWRWPLHGPLVGHFRVDAAPERYAAGQHRGIDVAAPPGHGSARRLRRPRDVRGLASRGAGRARQHALRRARRDVSGLAARARGRGAIVAPGRPPRRARRRGRCCASARAARPDRRGYLDPLSAPPRPRPATAPTLGPAPALTAPAGPSGRRARAHRPARGAPAPAVGAPAAARGARCRDATRGRRARAPTPAPRLAPLPARAAPAPPPMAPPTPRSRSSPPRCPSAASCTAAGAADARSAQASRASTVAL